MAESSHELVVLMTHGADHELSSVAFTIANGGMNPHGEFHFEMGRAMAERLGYSPADLDRIPAESIESFAGVGYYFHMAELRPGDIVVDLGSGSGMDTFIAH
jgi:hypothetical protein